MVDAKAAHQRAMKEWKAVEADRQRRLQAAHNDHETRVRQHLAEIKEHNRRVEQLAKGFADRERHAVESILSEVLGRVLLPDFPQGIEVTYSPQSEQAVIRMRLPGRSVVPTVRGYK